MAVPMASLQRAATNPLARTAGTVVSAQGIPVPTYPGAPVPGGGRPAQPNDPPIPPPTPPVPSPVLRDPYGDVPRPSAQPSSAAPSTAPLTPQQRADADAAMLARQRAADIAAGRRPAEVSYADQAAEEMRRSNEFQMQRAAVLRQQQEEERQRRLDADAGTLAEQQRIAAEREQQNLSARDFSTQLTRTPDMGAVTRSEGTLDAGASRGDLAALVSEARALGILDSGGSSSSSALGSLQTAALPPPVTHAPSTANTSAAFSQAKDRIGAIGRSAIDSLGRQFAGRGLSGSSIEGRAIGEAVERGAGALSDTARTEAQSTADRLNAVDDQTYQGDLSQRSTNISAGLARDAQATSRTNSQFSNLQALMALVRRGRAY